MENFFPINFVPSKTIQINYSTDNIDMNKSTMHNRSQSDYFSNNLNRSQIPNYKFFHRVCPIVNLFGNNQDYSFYSISFK